MIRDHSSVLFYTMLQLKLNKDQYNIGILLYFVQLVYL